MSFLLNLPHTVSVFSLFILFQFVKLHTKNARLSVCSLRISLEMTGVDFFQEMVRKRNIYDCNTLQ